MADCAVLEYKRLMIGTLRFTDFGSIEESYSTCRDRSLQNKMAVLSKSGEYIDPSVIIEGETNYCLEKSAADDCRLYVSPFVKTSRDLYRNAGFKIVRDPNKSHFVVIPDIVERYPYLSCDVLVHDEHTESLILYSVERNRRACQLDNGVISPMWDAIVKHFEAKGVTLVNDSLWFNKSVYFLPKIPEYQDMLMNVYPNRDYVFESSVPIDYPTVLSVETLRLWEMCDDMDVLSKTICNSNWKDYPTTLVVFLKEFHPEIRHYGGRNFELVLEQIGFDNYSSIQSILHGREIQPDDWNLLQDFLMSKLGLDAQGGFVGDNKFRASGITVALRKLFRSRLAIAPMRISKPISFENLQSLVENS